jgi:hypothetical protein
MVIHGLPLRVIQTSEKTLCHLATTPADLDTTPK